MTTTTSPDPDAQVETKPTVQPDEGLKKLYQSLQDDDSKYKAAWERSQSTFVKVVEYVKKQKLSRAIVVATLVAVKGMTESSAETEASRIIKAANPKNESVLQDLKTGTISMRAARRLIAKPQRNPRPQRSARERVFDHLITGARIAVANQREEGDKVYFTSSQDFTALAAEAWAQAIHEVASRATTAAPPQQVAA